MGKENETESQSESFEIIDHSFQKELQDLPEVTAYIERLQNIILRQRKILLRFYNEKKSKTDASTQTDVPLGQESSVSPSKSDVKLISDNWSVNSKDLGVSIQEQVTAAAENAMKQTGFVYEETSGMYYDYNTGYYYNAELGLYYDGNTGTYYYYDEARRTYHFHSKVEPSVLPKVLDESASQQKPQSETKMETENFSEESVKTKRKQCENEEGDDPPKKSKQGEVLEEGECSDSDNEEIKETDEIVKDDAETKVEDPATLLIQSNGDATSKPKSSIDNDEFDTEISKQYPPCMRVIVQESNVKGVKPGSLFMITWPGGTLGREGDHSILIPDHNVSKYHAKFSFSGENENGNYVLVDLGSKNGTYLNGQRLSVALSESDPFPVEHGSEIQIGSTKLLCHVHNGQETCPNCEPGVMITEDKKKEVIHVNKGENYKSELKRLKSKYGVESLSSALSAPAPGYEDKADIRRKTVGSSSDNFKTETASVQESIPSENKGFKMLAKMGWNKGQALGKEEKSDAITEPILIQQRPAKAGLGAEGSAPTKLLDPKEEKKQELWRKTQQRFKKLK
ncbi:angiogenic factor with G patch and FHA domains 1 isoform X1 [Bemisia tabaci]|uniref:angiogenic factor with G patch and FHA domains 1 isoform X1 n=1 Tax=Bemisia tabaci TaxID=7038 RepID=UPI003B28A8E1